MVNVISKTALVIDTDSGFRQLVGLRLEILGFKVFEAEDASAVRRVMGENSIDIVVSEFAVPGLEGEALFKILEPAKRPVFLFTQWATENPEEFARQTGVRAVIHKKRRSELFKQMEFLGSFTKTVPVVPQGIEKHILVIEDSATMRHILRSILTKEAPHCVIREAQDGREAISEMAQKKVDLIITDLQMPGMDGHTFIRKIRGNNLLKQKPILVFTSTTDLVDLKNEFANDPCLEILSKPSTPQEIVESLGRLWHAGEAAVRQLKSVKE